MCQYKEVASSTIIRKGTGRSREEGFGGRPAFKERGSQKTKERRELRAFKKMPEDAQMRIKKRRKIRRKRFLGQMALSALQAKAQFT
ncbi:MAG TPA: hypothetical protein VJB70_04860 [Candidatus Paceibacterota bacterium]